MIIISLENNNEAANTLTINTAGTVAEIIARQDVKDFFNGASEETIAGNLVELDGADLSALGTEDIRSICVTDDATLAFSLFGEYRQPVANTVTYGQVRVEVGGCFNSKSVRIKDGVTTVSEALNETVAAAFAKNRSDLLNMRMTINDVEVNCNTVLHDGDTISLQARKAGDKGATITVNEYNNPDELMLEIAGENPTVHDIVYEMNTRYDTGLAEDDIVSINDDVIPEDLSSRQKEALFRMYEAEGINNIEFDVFGLDEILEAQSNEDGDDDDVFGDDNEVLDADGVDMAATSVSNSQRDTGEVGSFGSVTVTQAIGTPTMSVGIKNKVTTVGDVLRSSKVLAKFAMNEAQICSLSILVNDVPATCTDKLAIGDTVKLAPRKAGDKGND